MKKRIFCILLCLSIVCSLFVMTVSAAVATLTTGSPDSYTYLRNNAVGTISKSVGDTGFYQRLPRLTLKCNRHGTILAEYAPMFYQIPVAGSYTLSDPDVIGNCAFEIGSSKFAEYPNVDCLQFNYKVLKTGTTTVTLTFYYNYDYSGGEYYYCRRCGDYLLTSANTSWYKETTTFTVVVPEDEVETFTIKYNDGAANGASFDEQTYTAEKDDPTPAFETSNASGEPTWKDHVFAGWAPEWESTVSGDVTYVAQWKDDKNNNGTPDDEEPFTVIYNDGIAGGESFTDQVHGDLLYGTPTPAFETDDPSGEPTWDGYNFTRWEPLVSDTVTESVTYVAQWEHESVTECTVTYNDGAANGASFEEISFTVAKGENTPVFPSGTPTWTDHLFADWQPTFSATVEKSVTYIAQWKNDKNHNGIDDALENQYTVTYTDGVEDEVVFEDEIYSSLVTGVQTPAFEGSLKRPGYKFNGWEPEWENTVTDDVIYTATWTESDDDWDDTGAITGSVMLAGLDTDDHIAYVYGYPDGTVRPDGTITRAEVTTIFYRLLTNARRDEISTSENRFSDVDSSKWYNKAASSMAAGGYIQGYSDGTFGANKPITRAEFVTIASRFASKTTAFASYSDVDNGHWAAKAIAVCASNGWVQGYEDGTFRPDQPITRAEAMTIINRMLGRGVSKGYICKGAVRYPDNEADSWYYYDVIEATNDHEYRNARPFEQWIRTSILRSYDMDKYERP